MAGLTEAASARSSPHVFGAGHSFLTDGKPHWIQKIAPMGFGHYPEARAEAWRRILSFFDRHLA